MELLIKILLLLSVFSVSQHAAAEAEAGSHDISIHQDDRQAGRSIIAQATEGVDSATGSSIQHKIKAGHQANKKRCMMVCIRWGEDCVISPDTGKRTCRRVCEEFGEQCF